MDLNKAFPGTYIKKEDLDAKQDTIYTITHGTMEEIGQEREEIPVLWFAETEMGLVLNKTNVGRIYSAHQLTDTAKLKGKKIALYVDHEVSFGGKTVGGVRVRATAPADDDDPGF